MTDATEADWDRVLGVNVKGYGVQSRSVPATPSLPPADSLTNPAAFMMKHAVPLMAARGGGSIVNVASISGLRAQPAFVPYSTSKVATGVQAGRWSSRPPRATASAPLSTHAQAAILGLSRNVALDVGRHNIRVSPRVTPVVPAVAAVRSPAFPPAQVNTVLPGPILTDGTRRHAASLGMTLEEVTAEMVRRSLSPILEAVCVCHTSSTHASAATVASAPCR